MRQNSHRILKQLAAVAFGVVMLNWGVQAQVYTGSIDFSGGATLNAPMGSAASFSSFFGPSGVADPVVLGGTQTGVYAGVPANTPVTFSTFAFNPLSGSTPLWSFTDGGTAYSFTITSESTYFQDANFLNLAGEGIANIGSTAMPATWSITSTGTGTSTVTFGAAIAAVPEPSTLALVLFGSIGCIALLRKKRSVAV